MRKRYVQVDGVLYEKGTEPRREHGPMIMPDIQPYRSMIDGTLITSRSHHRQHLKMHGCVEVGNDSSLQRTTPAPITPPKGLKEQIARQVYQKLRY